MGARGYAAAVLGSIVFFIVGSIAISELQLRDRFLYCNGKYAKTVAGALDEGHAVSFATNDFPDRCVTERLIASWSRAKDVVAVGSSRTMQITQALFPGTFYNASLWAARMNEYFAVVHLLEQHHRLPKKMIIGLDPHSVDGFDEDPRWIMLADEGTSALFKSAFALDGHRGAALRAALSSAAAAVKVGASRLAGHLSYASLRQATKTLRSCWCLDRYERATEITPARPGKHLVKLPDGSVIYEERLRTVPKEELRESGRKAAAGMLATRHAIAPHKLDQLWVLIAWLRAMHVEPIVWLAPFGPEEYSMIEDSANGAMILELEQLLRKEAPARGFTVVGSYDPRRIPCAVDDFLDWWHPQRDCVARAFSGT